MLLHEVIEFAASRDTDGVALVVSERSWTFAELWRDISRMAAVLAGMAGAGERIAVVSDNRAEVLLIQYAAPMASVVAMFGNTRLTPAELVELIEDVAPALLIGSEEQLTRLADVVGAVGSIRRCVAFEALDLGRPPEDVGSVLADRDPRPEDTAWIIHTSGTTGRAKGALLTHRSVLAAVLNTALCRPTAPDDVYLFPFPLFHVAAYNVIHLHLRGRPVVLVAKFDAVDVMTQIERHRVTSISLAPTMIAMLLDHPERAAHDLGSLRHVFYGASAIPIDVLRRGLAELGCEFGQGYGMTELSGNAVFLDAAAHRRAVGPDPHLLAAAGRVGPLAAVRLVDDDLRDVEPGESGEIVIRGEQVVAGYWNRPGASAHARTADGWFRTGDVGRFDAEGFLYVVDRRKDIIVTGGENVASREVEDVLVGHPLVRQVAVVGAPHPQWGEQVVAVVVTHDPALDPSEIAAEIGAWSRGRIAGFKRPRHVLITDALPLNASGKVLKAELRALVVERLSRR